MAQFKELMADLTFTDGVDDAKLIRERIHSRPIKTQAWDYEKTLKNLFFELSDSDRGSSAKKTKFGTLVRIELDGWNNSKEKVREDCAFLMAKVLLHRKEDEINFIPNWRDLSGKEYNYIYSFCMELLLPENDMIAHMSGDSSQLTYDEIMVQYGVTVETTYARMLELDLL